MKLTAHLESLYSPFGKNSMLRMFAALVYSWFIFQAISLWPVKELLWGTEKIFYRHGFADGILRNFIYQLVYESARAPFVFYLHIASAMLSIFDRSWSFIPRFTNWVTGLMLFYSATEVYNSGMMLMLVMAFMMAFVHAGTTIPMRIAINRMIYYAAIVQVCIVYFVAGMYKLSGEQWLKGDAVYYTLQIDHYSSAFWQSKNVISSGITLLLNYIALFYQLLFPLLLLLKKWRWIVLMIGVAFHLFIGLVMHLWDFALAMLICYVLFLDEQKVIAFQNILASSWRKLRR